MHSSTSSFKPSDTAPVYQRALPALNVGRAWLIAGLIFLLGLGAWEAKWRAWGAQPTIRNSDGLWAMQRRRIDEGEGDKTVVLGASRALFDVQLPVWERVFGERPIQLAMEGTSPLPMLEDLADDPKFTGRLVIGIAPDVFFTGFGYRGGVVKSYKKETPAQRAGQWLSTLLIEPLFAFYDDDFRLMTVLKRQPWPARAGVKTFLDVRKLTMHDRDRNTRMWSKVEHDPAYRALCREVWAQSFDEPIPGGETPEKREEMAKKEIERTAAALQKLRARGVRKIVFIRLPSTDQYLAVENRDFPRVKTWDVLLQKTGLPGIHFEDYAEMQGLTLPEWSHLRAADADRYTEALCKILQRDFGWTASVR